MVMEKYSVFVSYSFNACAYDMLWNIDGMVKFDENMNYTNKLNGVIGNYANDDDVCQRLAVCRNRNKNNRSRRGGGKKVVKFAVIVSGKSIDDMFYSLCLFSIYTCRQTTRTENY